MKQKIPVFFNFVALVLILFSFAAAQPDKTARAIRITPAAPQFSDVERVAEFKKRRANVAAKIGKNAMLILFSAEPRLYTNNINYEYRQENNLFYLSGLKDHGATLVLLTDKDGAAREILFLPKREASIEIVDGRMLGHDEARKMTGIETIFNTEEFPQFLEAAKKRESFAAASLAAIDKLFLLLPNGGGDSIGLREYSQEFKFANDFAAVTPNEKNGGYAYEPKFGYKIEQARFAFADLRLIKSAMEIKILRHSIDITTEAFGRAAAVVGRSNYEYEVEAEVEYTFRKRNADFWGYPSIIGCGANGTTPHYMASQGAIRRGETLVMDVGAEFQHYTADITRTLPVSGKFSKEQLEIYQIVYDAQEAIAAAIKPGADFKMMNEIAAEVQKKALHKLGLIESPDAVFTLVGKDGKPRLDREGKPITVPQHRTWTLHGTSHWLGMNVHDVGAFNFKFQPGVIFTNEPGVYIRADALENVPESLEKARFVEFARPMWEKYKNIGVRIEDDMLVTATGAEWLTKNLPRKPAEIEAMIARAAQELPPSATAVNHFPKSRILFDADKSFLVNEEFQPGRTTRGGFAFVGTTSDYAEFARSRH